jgi:hypothetical protein
LGLFEIKCVPPFSHNVYTNHAVVFAAKNDSFSRGKNNGATTTVLYKKGSVVVCAVSRWRSSIIKSFVAHVFN